MEFESVGNLKVSKSDAIDQRIVMVEVYAPLIPDSDGDIMDAETIEKMAHDFMKAKKLDKIDVQHDNKTYSGLSIVESFIARKDDTTFIPGAWVVGIHIDNDDIWNMVKKGELNGVSMEALVTKTKGTLDMEIPPVVRGLTTKSEDHEHEFFVSFDINGNFLGGRTSMSDGHFHTIRAGTVTDTASGVQKGSHSHRFSFVEGLV